MWVQHHVTLLGVTFDAAFNGAKKIGVRVAKTPVKTLDEMLVPSFTMESLRKTQFRGSKPCSSRSHYVSLKQPCFTEVNIIDLVKHSFFSQDVEHAPLCVKQLCVTQETMFHSVKLCFMQ